MNSSDEGPVAVEEPKGQDPKELLERHLQYIQETNEAFRVADRSRRRVMLAEDILKQLTIGRIVADSCYFHLPWDGVENGGELDMLEELQSIMKTRPVCEVCGIGALMVAAVERVDDFRLADLWGTPGESRFKGNTQGNIHGYLISKDLFNHDELYTIERFFEGHQTVPIYNPEWLYLSRRSRMWRIMEVIIETEGRESIRIKHFTAAPTAEMRDRNTKERAYS